MENVEDSTYRGKRIGDMDRSELLKIIEYLEDAWADSKESHTRTLDMWRECRERKSI